MVKEKNRYHDFFIVMGNNIKKYRNKAEISQEELAFRVESARNYIGCVERAEKIPSLPFILDVAKALNCSLIDLLED